MLVLSLNEAIIWWGNTGLYAGCCIMVQPILPNVANRLCYMKSSIIMAKGTLNCFGCLSRTAADKPEKLLDCSDEQYLLAMWMYWGQLQRCNGAMRTEA
ncbi:hypothetical protein KIN20_017228 [Parelaphostrongylus tenuis]|uniref:Uncharacterized protein n=1 Tax=Parelaphostrongylus tenuis TaxID=148309 RepID=A0AAD5MMY1_PARTN|nr:hypothetical protein KIN20_017228 [Parelaphostrongylus tenuis]